MPCGALHFLFYFSIALCEAPHPHTLAPTSTLVTPLACIYLLNSASSHTVEGFFYFWGPLECAIQCREHLHQHQQQSYLMQPHDEG